MPNRLHEATSPYLLQHADNPVDWWEWSPEAFEDARRRDVPVLLSVGYAACHWCHVMAHESFEDEATAAYLQVLEALADAWANRREEVGTVAADVSQHLRQEVALAGEEPLDEDLLAGVVRSLATDFDATAGGFGGAPKFPPSMVLELLLRHAARTGAPNASGMADRTLRAMARGGIFD